VGIPSVTFFCRVTDTAAGTIREYRAVKRKMAPTGWRSLKLGDEGGYNTASARSWFAAATRW
jgi:hypothetical protein